MPHLLPGERLDAEIADARVRELALEVRHVHGLGERPRGLDHTLRVDRVRRGVEAHPDAVRDRGLLWARRTALVSQMAVLAGVREALPDLLGDRPVGAAGDLVEDAHMRQDVDRRPRAGDRRLPVIERLGEHEDERPCDGDACHGEGAQAAAAPAAGAREIAVDAGAQRRAEAVGHKGLGCHGCSPPASAVRSRRSARETRRRAAAGWISRRRAISS